MITVAEINDVHRLVSLQPVWDDLLRRTPGAGYLQSAGWLRSYWEHFGGGKKLRVLFVSAGQEPVGILPLLVKPAPSRLGRVRVLTYPLDGWGAFYGPVGPSPAATLTAGLKHIHATRRDWEIIDLGYVDAQGIDRGRTRNALRHCGLAYRQRMWMRVGTIEPGTSWPEFFASLPEDVRRDYRDAEEEIEQLGPVEYVRHRPGDDPPQRRTPRWELFDQFQRLAEEHARRPSRTPASPHSFEREFLPAMHAVAVEDGAVDLNLLFADGRPLAGAYNVGFGGRLDVVRLVLAEEAAPSAATVLLGRMLRDSCHRADGSLIFTGNTLFAARGWASRLGMSHRYTHFAPTVPRAQMLRLHQYLKSWWRSSANGRGRIGEGRSNGPAERSPGGVVPLPGRQLTVVN